MERNNKVQYVLSCIPFFGFLIVWFIGMFKVYAVRKNRLDVFVYDFMNFLPITVFFIPIALAVVFATKISDATIRIIGILCVIVLILTLLSFVLVLFQQWYIKRLKKKNADQYLS